MFTSQKLLRLNVGFIVHQSIGYSREFPIEIPGTNFAEDLEFEDLAGIVTISRTTEGLLVQVKCQAHTKADCVLCLEQFEQPLQLDFVEMYTFPSHADKDTELILPDDLNIDLFPLIREYLYLDMPISPTCRSDCKGLCPICGENLNQMTCSHDLEMGDSRMNVLKSLLDDDQISG